MSLRLSPHESATDRAGSKNQPLPGLNPGRLANLMRQAVRRCRLDLSGAVVVTEAATGAYAVTPILAAMAEASKVFAVARPSRHGTVRDVVDQTNAVALAAKVPGVVEVITELTSEIIARADVLTNSGHVRPIDRRMVGHMKPTAVIPLMYESWEFRDSDVDLAACRERGIPVAGTNERHPEVDVFSYLGMMAVKLLLDAGVSIYRSRILVLCDNPFESYIRRGLVVAGASVNSVADLGGEVSCEEVDAIVVAQRPGGQPVIGPRQAGLIAERFPGVVVAQFWGDLDRDALDRAGVVYWPEQAPKLGHMGVLPSDIGPEAIVRLQAGGLKVAEVLRRKTQGEENPEWEYLDVI
ncbi:hypothetical protein V5E97_35000 [Singulisphaera sp. Ch08]|uniref:Uncharacterized protein n=1 Tax=Singulisphaera sp. Ch08 TaxID=3120278 RepID=A0AAU7CE75_9BACT